ncbi:ABC transporter permease [Arthrobacter sp. zg-Y20]|uniref:ABC transporter permease n=1 Tax=unclassified Arthrobacter TaxID=235627 RepID=UPI001D13FF8C|nr:MULTISPECIES: ABC transporter permease [unclassified Arthrobacter]MCC3274942.1 ABC transporter permease [Arthrobacter sp. zg-Y20]MDK1315099.1 ABC transporter permease [Arthrobacter sp. zg.Y20]MDK1327962.1 ABC transporter permease [Arthrobacter sp. zg-Y1143]WIB04944.1 ABC transporter permease [Arthrobacter sp. zg-Y20]
MSNALTGTGPLLRATVRFDGRSFVPWILIATALSASSVLVYPWVFPTQQDRLGLALAIGSNPALGLIFGPAYDLSTDDGFNAWRSLALGGFLAALGSIFTVTRSSRGQEDSGQAELLASGVLGRNSRLLAGVSLALIGSVALGGVAGVVTSWCGGSWNASLLLGATFTATGWMFAAVAAVTAQLGSDARTANSLAVGTFGALFLLRGFLYSVEAPDWTSWINPLSWMTETRPASGNHWWPLLPAMAVTLVLLGIAFLLQSRRDFGQGAIVPGPGPARGRGGTPWSLAVRLNRAPLLTWTVAFMVIGVVFGFFARSLKDILSGDSAAASVLASGAATPDALAPAFLTTILSLVGILAAIPGVQIVQKVRTEELAGRLEPVLAAAVPRSRYFTANVILALAAPTIYLLLAGAIIAVLASGELGIDAGRVLLQAVVTVPAVCTATSVSAAVVGARPRLVIASWAGVFISFALTLLGPTFRLWDWVLAISPFWHVPNVSVDEAGWAGLAGISAVTAVFLLIGFAGFRRRDLDG